MKLIFTPGGQMNEKLHPILQFVQDHTSYILAFVLSMWGGVVQYAQKVRAGEEWSFKNLALDCIVCSFSGLMAYAICQYYEIDGWQMVIIVSLSSHAGARAIGRMTYWSDKILGLKKEDQGDTR